MSVTGYVCVGEDRLPYSLAAIQAVGLSSGDRVTSIDVLLQLSAADAAHTEALGAICRAQISALLE